MIPGFSREESPSQRGSFRLEPNERGKRVIILGAGLAGMACAYELGKVGYDCIILEARSRAGCRCWTLRGGDRFTDTLGQTQTVQFDSGLYFNPGPARIPQEHITLDYCREFGVAVEVSGLEISERKPCGEHLSYLQGWMAGALESARLVSSKINTLA